MENGCAGRTWLCWCRTLHRGPTEPAGIMSDLGRICNSARSLSTLVQTPPTRFSLLSHRLRLVPFLSSWNSANGHTLRVPTPSILRRGPRWTRTERPAMRMVSVIQTNQRMAMTSRYGFCLVSGHMYDSKLNCRRCSAKRPSSAV